MKSNCIPWGEGLSGLTLWTVLRATAEAQTCPTSLRGTPGEILCGKCALMNVRVCELRVSLQPLTDLTVHLSAQLGWSCPVLKGTRGQPGLSGLCSKCQEAEHTSRWKWGSMAVFCPV